MKLYGPILAILSLAGMVGIFYLGFYTDYLGGNSPAPKQSQPAPVVRAPTITPKPTQAPVKKVAQPVTPKIECVGPDGVRFQTTQKECDDFNSAWNKPKPTAVPPQNTNSTASTSYTAPNYPPCVIYYPSLGYSSTYTTFSPEYCQQLKDENISNSTPSPTSAPIAQPTKTQEEINLCKAKITDEYYPQIQQCTFMPEYLVRQCQIAVGNEMNSEIAATCY